MLISSPASFRACVCGVLDLHLTIALMIFRNHHEGITIDVFLSHVNLHRDYWVFILASWINLYTSFWVRAFHFLFLLSYGFLNLVHEFSSNKEMCHSRWTDGFTLCIITDMSPECLSLNTTPCLELNITGLQNSLQTLSLKTIIFARRDKAKFSHTTRLHTVILEK